jgi:diguanylate cyclase (GGDEF)-like protein
MELARVGRSGGCGSLLWLDIDFFKEVNDSLGHAAGDELLLSLSMFLKDKTRDDSLLARLGGDEFAVLLPSADTGQAQAAAHRLLEAVSGNEFQVGRHPVRVSVSVGIVSFPQHGTSVAELLARADLAMYHAKDEGRNRACAYQPEADWHSELQHRMTWRERIEEALEADDFTVYAQPVIDLADDSVARYELLIRMIGEDGAIIMPGTFLPAAERLGLVHRIDRWMVREAIHLIERHQRRGIRLDVNLSGRAFEDRELLPLIERELEQSDVDPSSLGLEITETAAIVDMAKAQYFIKRLGSLGCRFSLDDFGSGFSSFYYLKQLPIDGLKIDGAFIQSLPTSEKDQHLVRAIVELSRGLGTQVTAEFVESAEILTLLKDYQVDCAQGYYIGVPGPVEEVLAADASPTAE